MTRWDAIAAGDYAGAKGALWQGGARLYRTVTDALNDAPANPSRPYVILVNRGRYYEKLTIDKPFITLVGQDRDDTLLTFDAANGTLKPDGMPYGTSGSASITVRASDFRAENLTIANGFDYPANAAKLSTDSTRVANAQAVALRTEEGSDRALFYNVKFSGFQDTLYADAGRHYFLRCSIAGHIDFIFGAGQAVFEDCDILSRDRGSATDNGYITAASTPRSCAYGFLFVNCRLRKQDPTLADGTVALGRPWHPTRDLPDGTRTADPNAAGSVVYKHCWMDSHIAVHGWAPMAGKDKHGRPIWFYPTEARFYEYGSTGPGALASETRRVLSPIQAEQYTIANVLDHWIPDLSRRGNCHP